MSYLPFTNYEILCSCAIWRLQKEDVKMMLERGWMLQISNECTQEKKKTHAWQCINFLYVFEIYWCNTSIFSSYLLSFLLKAFIKFSIEGVPWGTTISNLDFSNVHYCKNWYLTMLWINCFLNFAKYSLEGFPWKTTIATI